MILYRTGGSRIVFGGDSHDETWDHILEHHEDDVTDIDLLIAPHHGRKSGRSYKLLDTLTPDIVTISLTSAVQTGESAPCQAISHSLYTAPIFLSRSNFFTQS